MQSLTKVLPVKSTLVAVLLLLGLNPQLNQLSATALIQQDNSSPEISHQKNSDSKKLQPETVISAENPQEQQVLAQESTNISASEQNRIQQKLKENPWVFLHPFNATYSVYRGKKKVGSATRNMQVTEDLWKIELSANLKKWFISLKSKEYSSFQILDKAMLVKEFYTSSKVSFKDRKTIIQQFDWQTKVETGKKGKANWQLPLEQPTYDRMSHIIKLRADLLSNKEKFDYIISYKGRRELYSYQKAGIEIIKTPMGELMTWRMNRDNGDESNSIWFCPELNFFPVKIAKFEQDEPEVTLELNNLEYTKPAEPKVAKK